MKYDTETTILYDRKLCRDELLVDLDKMCEDLLRVLEQERFSGKLSGFCSFLSVLRPGR